MGDQTSIEWTDATWNPVTGCTKVSPGCGRCYAETFAERFRGTPGHHFEGGFDLTLRPGRLDQPLRWTRPRKIFVNSMSDLFHDQVHTEYIARVWAVMALAPRHTFQVLTKRHGRMRSLLSTDRSGDRFQQLVAAAVHDQWGRGNWRRGEPPRFQDSYQDRLAKWPLPNVWLGVSTEDQKRLDLRRGHLEATQAAVRFLSCEPLLGPLDLSPMLPGPVLKRPVLERLRRVDLVAASAGVPTPAGVGWVIVGGESGRGARPMHPGWVRDLQDQCGRSGVPFLFKQWGEWAPVLDQPRDGDRWISGRGSTTTQRGALDDGAEVVSAPGRPWQPGSQAAPPGRRDPYGEVLMRRVGKKRAGRLLDGRSWEEYPMPGTLGYAGDPLLSRSGVESP